MTIIPKVGELIKLFKDSCYSKGWKTSERVDWVETGGEYHNFIWVRAIHPLTFWRVTTNSILGVHEGTSYRVVNVSYIAWIFSETPPESIAQLVKERPKLSKRIAIYDLSRAYTKKPVCSKLNETDSMVFREFENFLDKEYKVKINPIHRLTSQQPVKLGL